MVPSITRNSFDPKIEMMNVTKLAITSPNGRIIAAKARIARNNEDRSADLVFVDARAIRDQTDQRNQGAKSDEETGEKPRRGAGTECKSALPGKLARGPDGKDGHRDEDQTTPEIAGAADRKTKSPPLGGRADAFGHVPSRSPALYRGTSHPSVQPFS